jgi:hypothetical protein
MKWHQLACGIICGLLISFRASATVYYVDVNSANPTPPFTNWSTAATDIQSAVDTSTNGDLILVTNGIYQTGGRVVYGSLTNRVVINKAVTLQSVNGPAVTAILGYQNSTNITNSVRCVYMTNNAVLNGFTLQGGGTLSQSTDNYDARQSTGGGVYGESTNTILTNCFLIGNICKSQAAMFGGAGAYQATLNNCILSNNVVQGTGGGADHSVLNNCLVVSNSASDGGGTAYSTLNYCTVIGNSAPFNGTSVSGGGTYQCVANHCLIARNYAGILAGFGGGDYDGQLTDCILSNNAAGSGGGSAQFMAGGNSLNGYLNNCLVISNTAFGNGGGIYVGSGAILVCNCTIVKNTATNQYGGIYNGYCTNCIIYYNSCNPLFSSAFNYFYYTYISYGCTTPLPFHNLGSITNDPVFVNPTAGDFHLASNSPCINSGKNLFVIGTNDLDGNPRIVGGTVDIGAYEYQTPASVLSYAWAQQYGLPTDGSADFTDPDGDGLNNWQEWKAGTIPTNAASVLQLASPSNSVAGVTVTWQSVSGVTYYLQSSTNLAAVPAFTALQSNLVGQAGSTSYTDTSATNGGPYFYRVGVQ